MIVDRKELEKKFKTKILTPKEIVEMEEHLKKSEYKSIGG